jgi:hypothetical protein
MADRSQLQAPSVVPGMGVDFCLQQPQDGVAHLFLAVPAVEAARGPDIDDQPALGEPRVLHGDLGQVPDRAVRSVAAKDQASGEGAHLRTCAPGSGAATWTQAAVRGPGAVSGPKTAAPRKKLISGCRPTRASRSASRSGWWNMLACGKPFTPGRRSRRNSAITRWRASSRRSPLPGRDRARKPSLTPT